MKENIDNSVWINYFNEFTRRNESRPTRLEVFDEFGVQPEERGLTFAGIALERDVGGLPSVEIMLGSYDVDKPRRQTRVITNVQEITPKRGRDGRDEALEIISGDGRHNLLRFEPEARMSAHA